jgi:hypothetical protein
MRDEPRAVRELIERLVRESNLPDARAREELRRELVSHFEECGGSEDALREALARFGSPDVVARGFRAAYRRGRAALYVAKVMASVVAASAIALALELIANLRVGGGGAVHVGRGYLVSAIFALTIVVVLVAAWELDIEPLCARLERKPLRLAATYGALFAGLFVGHPLVHGPMALHAPMHVGLILVASTTALAVWAATVAIAARLDLLFLRLLRPPEG